MDRQHADGERYLAVGDPRLADRHQIVVQQVGDQGQQHVGGTAGARMRRIAQDTE